MQLPKFPLLNKWQTWAVGAAIIFALVYAGWCKWGAKPPAPGQTVTATEAKVVASMPRKMLENQRVQVIRDGSRATEKLKIDPPQPHEEVQTAVTIPQNHYGGTATVFLNTTTGQSRTVIRANTAPWFRFERENRAGVEVGMGREGRYVSADYQRDLCSIKGIILAARVSVASYPNETDYRAGIRAEYRW